MVLLQAHHTFYQMKFYYLATTPNSEGKFEVHERDCELIPTAYDRDYLGPFNSGHEAIRKGQKLNENAVICPRCVSDKPIPVVIRSRKSN